MKWIGPSISDTISFSRKKYLLLAEILLLIPSYSTTHPAPTTTIDHHPTPQTNQWCKFQQHNSLIVNVLARDNGGRLYIMWGLPSGFHIADMISLALRQGARVPRIRKHHNVVYCNVGRFAATLSSFSYQYTKRSRFCIHRSTTSSSRSHRLITPRYIYRRKLRRSSYQSAHYFSTCQEDEQPIGFLVNTAEEHDLVATRTDNGFTTTNRAEISFSRMAQKRPFMLHVPKSFLEGGFSKKYGSGHLGIYKCLEENLDGESWYTATVEDPVTGELFSSGMVSKDVDVKARDNSSLKLPLHLAKTRIIDGKVCYPDKRTAEHAAAARAIDCHLFRENYAGIDNIQLCVEEPYASNENGRDAKQKIEYETPKEVERSCFIPIEDGVDPDQSDVPALSLSIDKESTAGVAETEHTLSTMGRITEIWADTAAFSPSLGSGKETTHYEHDSPATNIESILEWYEKVLNNEPQNYSEALAMSTLFKKILTAIGNAIQHEKESYMNVERDAKKILDKIILLSQTFDGINGSGSSFVDINTFNAYIKCINRLNPTSSSKTAQNLLGRMKNRKKFKGVILPQPTADTYNEVMRICALVDRSQVNDVYAKMVVCPNKDTFKILLAANSKVDGHFSFEEAKHWMSAIEQISVSRCGEALNPNADMYNSALGHLSNTESIGSQYANLLLSYGSQYDGGFKNIDQSSAEDENEASDISKWLLYAEECGVNPNVEMYEQVIRAYTKTGTKKGLLMAEDWARRAVSSGSLIRVQTFHPIIAAWTLCGIDRAPGRVKEWISQLNTLSLTNPSLKPDLNTLSAQIIAWRYVQKGLIDRLEEDWMNSSPIKSSSNAVSDETIIVNEIFGAAQQCMHHLEEMVTTNKLNISQTDTDAMVTMLKYTIEAWGCASRLALDNPSMSSISHDTSHGVNEMLKVVHVVNSKMDEDLDEKHAQQILQIMGETYTEVISQLHQIDSMLESDDAEGTCYFSQELEYVEKMLQDYDLYAQKYTSLSNSKETALRHRLYKEILQGCKGMKSPTDFEHVLRLSTLIMDQLSLQDEQHTADIGEKIDLTEIYMSLAIITGKSVEDPEERKDALTVVWNNAKRFFWRRFNPSSYGKVERARIIGALRQGMGEDLEITEDFIRSFDDWPANMKSGGGWGKFVDDLLKKKRR